MRERVKVLLYESKFFIFDASFLMGIKAGDDSQNFGNILLVRPKIWLSEEIAQKKVIHIIPQIKALSKLFCK